MTKKLRAAVLGPGNIGIDLMIKLLRSPWLDMVLMAGIDPQSEGLRIAAEKGVDTTIEGIDGVLKYGQLDIVFDATGAKPHLKHAPLLKQAGIFTERDLNSYHVRV